MSAHVRLEGVDELRRFFTTASTEVRADAMGIVRETTEQAAREIARQYPQKTGTLARRVVTRYPSSEVLAGVVSSAAPHSHLYEFGTKPRRNATGANRGRMPGKPVTVPVATRLRDLMLRRLMAMVRRHGFVVE